jgi:hypothetical protein
MPYRVAGVKFSRIQTDPLPKFRYWCSLKLCRNGPRITDMETEHEDELAIRLRQRFDQFFAKAGEEVIPSGTLGKGMEFQVKCGSDASYDKQSEAIVMTGSIIFMVRRSPSP